MPIADPYKRKTVTHRMFCLLELRICLTQGIGIKERAMALVWHEKASPTAIQTSSVQTHNLTTVKESAEQCLHL